MVSTRHPRVLVVDDLADAADSLGILLGLWGYVARVCYDGAEALVTARCFRPQCVLLDVAMPGLDGFQVAQLLRARPESADTVLIGISGYGGEAYRARARLAGMDHYLLKPADLDDLKTLLGRVVPGRPALESTARATASHRGRCRAYRHFSNPEQTLTAEW